MAKKRRTSRMPAGLRRYWNKKQGGTRRKKRSTSVAKRRRRKSSSPVRRRRSSPSRRRRRSGGGGGGSMFPMLGLPSKEELMKIGATGVMGYMEVKASSDADHIMNKIPRPIEQIGYSGGTALFLWLVAKYGPAGLARWARILAAGSANIAAYHMGKRYAGGGELLFNNTNIVAGLPTFGVEGEGDMIDEVTMGALAAEGDYVGDDDDDGELVAGDEELAVLGED